MNVLYLKEAYLSQLRTNIESNTSFYQQDEPWIDIYFAGTKYHLPSNIYIEDIKLVEPKSTTDHYDLENTKIVYGALKSLNVVQAADERLWAYFTHVTFWKYMRLRWPVERYLDNKTNLQEVIRERYFFQSNRDRALVRNGIARLWWYGYVSFDQNRSDPYELTRILLSKLDIAQSLLERSFSRSKKITKTILSVLAEIEKRNKPLPNRKKFRDLTKYINQLGGVTILDALDRDDIEKIVVKKIG